MTEAEKNLATDIADAVSNLAAVLYRYNLTLQRVEVTRKVELPLKVSTPTGDVTVEGPRPVYDLQGLRGYGQQLYGNQR